MIKGKTYSKRLKKHLTKLQYLYFQANTGFAFQKKYTNIQSFLIEILLKDRPTDIVRYRSLPEELLTMIKGKT